MNAAQKKMLEELGGSGDAASVIISLLTGGTGQDRRVYNPLIERTGDKLVIPEGSHLPDVIRSLQRQHDREEQYTQIHVTLPVSPWDGAMALMKAIEQQLGVFIQKPCECGRPSCGVHQMDIEVELGKTIQVPWGTFELPGMEDAEVAVDTVSENGRLVFSCNVSCKRRYEDRVRRLLDLVREIASKESLHRGKAFSIMFRDGNGRSINMPKPKFFEYAGEEPIFRQDLTAAIERNIVVPIRHAEGLVQMGESLKRSILFAGTYGVGKTLLASHIARIATAAGWTFIYVKNSEELPEALRYAEQYQPVVVFAEDVDRVAGVQRTNAVNELLNQLDGIDSKSARIMTILTTNHPEQVNEAMRRPGRIDLVLEVMPPDAETVGRMIKTFGSTSLEAVVDLTTVSEILEGETPARIRETVSRAKLESLRRAGKAGAKINGADLAAVAQEVKAEADMFKRNASRPEASHNVKAIAAGFASAATAMLSSTNGSGSTEAHLQ